MGGEVMIGNAPLGSHVMKILLPGRLGMAGSELYQGYKLHDQQRIQR
jgi:hypothetical protein